MDCSTARELFHSREIVMRPPFFVRVMAIVVCAVASTHVATAQETSNTATVSGRVTDPQGAAAPGAQVAARQTETNVTRATVTDAEGRFRFSYLQVGPYEISVRMQGFKEATRALMLTVGSAFEVPV